MAEQPQNTPRDLITKLPVELLEIVMALVDVGAPSSVRSTRRPVRNLFRSEITDLKSLSMTCKSLRQIVLPHLLRHVRICFDSFLRTSHDLDAPHADYILQNLNERLNELIVLLRRTGAVESVQSVLITFHTFFDARFSPDADFDQSARVFDDVLMEVINPKRLVYHGPAYNVLMLIGCVDPMAWTDVKTHLEDDFNVLELTVDTRESTDRSDAVLTDPNDPRNLHHGFARSSTSQYKLHPNSVLFSRRWSKVGLNEGHYKHFLVEPEQPYGDRPSLLPYLMPPCCDAHLYRTPSFRNSMSEAAKWQHLQRNMTWLDEFAYTALGSPNGLFGDQRNIYRAWSMVRSLELRLLAHPDDEEPEPAIYEDGNFNWFWREQTKLIVESYVKLRKAFDTGGISESEYTRLRTVVSRDRPPTERIREELHDFFALMFGGVIHKCTPDGLVHWGRVWRSRWAEGPRGSNGGRWKVTYTDE